MEKKFNNFKTGDKKPFNNSFKKNSYYESSSFIKPLPTHTIESKYVCKTNHGGRQRRKSVTLLVGDKNKHQIGIGSGKSATAQNAAKKAEVNANKNLQNVKVFNTKGGTVNTFEQQTIIKSHGLKLIIKPLRKPNLICANNLIKSVMKLAGLNAGNVKIHGKGSKVNQVNAFMSALTSMESPRDVAKRTGLSMEKIIERDNIFKTIMRRK